MLPNEAFTGKGHKNHICRKCSTLPKEEQESIAIEDELFKMTRQSHISPRNIERLADLSTHKDGQIASMASMILEVAKRYPYKKRRYTRMAHEQPDLLEALDIAGLLPY
jgi:hypothetical protein